MFLRGEDPTDQERLVGMEFLNACINETLRLAPPVPSGSQRGVPPSADGKLVGSQSVPELSPDSFAPLMICLLTRNRHTLPSAQFYSRRKQHIPELLFNSSGPSIFLTGPRSFLAR